MKFREISCLFREITKDISPYFAELSRNGIPLETLATNSGAWSDTARIDPRNLVRRSENPAKYSPVFETLRNLVCSRVSYETNIVSKQPKLEPKPVSALSETRRLFRLVRFNIKTGSFGVSKQPKQTKDQPKQQQIC
jgi:hypothetical protein